jgi:hypothetical protein
MDASNISVKQLDFDSIASLAQLFLHIVRFSISTNSANSSSAEPAL